MNVSSKSLKGRLDRKLFNAAQFKKANRVDRCFMALVAGPSSSFTLTEVEAEYLELMEEAYALIKEHLSPAMARKMLLARLNKLTHRRYSAIQIIEDAQTLFGRFDRVHRGVQRGVLRERMAVRIQYCERQLDTCEPKEAPAWEKLIKDYLVELAKIDKVSEEEAGRADTSLPKVIFSSNPELLKQETEDTEYEEL